MLGQGPDLLGSFPPGGGLPLPVPPRACQRAAPQPGLPGWSLPALSRSSGARRGPPLWGDVRGRRTPLAALRHGKISVGWEGRQAWKEAFQDPPLLFPIPALHQLQFPCLWLHQPPAKRPRGVPAPRGQAGCPFSPARRRSPRVPQPAPPTAAGSERAVWSRRAPEASPGALAPPCKGHRSSSGPERCGNAQAQPRFIKSN